MGHIPIPEPCWNCRHFKGVELLPLGEGEEEMEHDTTNPSGET